MFVLLFQIVDAIGRIEQTRGETNTAAALHDIRRHFFSTKHSPRDGIVRIAIIVTDGRSDHPLATSREATLLRDSGVHVFAVGVGQDIDMGELHAIASRPAADYVNTVDNYDALNSIKELLAIKACQGEIHLFTYLPIYLFICHLERFFFRITYSSMTLEDFLTTTSFKSAETNVKITKKITRLCDPLSMHANHTWNFSIQFSSAILPRIWLQLTNFIWPRSETPNRFQRILKL